MSYLSTLLAQAPGLKTDLQRLDRWNLASRLAGLLTCPDCHVNTLRLEAIVHLAVAVSAGKEGVDRENLERLFAEHLSNTDLTRAEDPPEDVFISNVFEATGNHRIFEGLWERNDYCLQTLIRASKLLPKKEAYAVMLRNVGALLDLSEAVAERNRLERYTAGGGEPGGNIFLPDESRLEGMAQTVIFSVDDLKSLGIDPEALAPFVWKDKAPEKLVAAGHNQTPLERRPILRRQDTYLLALPAAVSIACRRYILEVAGKEGDLRKLDFELSHFQGHDGERTLSRLQASPWNPEGFPRPPSRGVVSLTLMPFKFDTDKFGVLAIVQPPLETALKHGFGRYQNYVIPAAPVAADLRIVADFIAAQPGFRHGLFILAIGGVGMPLALPNPQLPAPWEFVSYSIADLETLCHAKGADLSMVWRLARQRTAAEAAGVEILNPNGDFNLFAIWQNADYSLIPPEVPLDQGNLLFVPSLNALLDLRMRARMASDAHVAPRNQPRECYLEVERKNPHAWFKAVREAPFYANVRRGGELRGVLESPGAWWWVVSLTPPRSAFQASITFQLWDCVSSWAVQAGAELSRRFVPRHAVCEFQLNFIGIETWTQAVGTIPTNEINPAWSITTPGVAEIQVTEEFFKTFMQVENRAERAIVAVLLDAGSQLLGQSLTAEEVRSTTDRLLPLGSARCFHVIPGHDATLTSDHGPADSSGLRDDVLAEVLQELGAAIAPDRRGQKTDDPEAVRQLVRSAVANLKGQISVRLKQYSLREVVVQSLRVLDATHRDFHRWKISASALLALYPDSEDVIGEANRRERERAGASTAARALIESALYSCPVEGGESPSENALQELLALTQTLVNLANYDLPKRAGFPAGSVRIAPNGRLFVANDFLDNFRLSYIRSTFDRGYRTSAGQYKDLFGRESKGSLPADFEELNAVLKAELGWTAVDAVDVGNHLNGWGMREAKSILVVPRSELRTFLAEEMEQDSDEVERAIKGLSIYPRSDWDKDLPAGCDRTDTFPWRFKRRFGLLRRPFIQITHGDDPMMVVSPFLVQEALAYLVENCHRGEFPPQFYAADRAKAFVNAAIDRRSAAFVEHTADVMRKAGYSVKCEVMMDKLGAPDRLGDIDVLAWRDGTEPEIWAIECKALRNARSTEEMLDQLDDFRGEASDRLDRHRQRLNWLLANQTAVADYTKLSAPRIAGRIVTSHQAPMQFLANAEADPFFIDVDTWEGQLKAPAAGG